MKGIEIVRFTFSWAWVRAFLRLLSAQESMYKLILVLRFFTIDKASSLVCAFILTPFLGRKIAYDEDFREKYIPKWFDYTLNKPKNAWTKEELHEQVVLLQQQLHKRAINGEFTPEKLDEMRRTMHKKPEKEEYAHFAKLHPGVDDDEDLED
jgi:hypothetical protein